MTSLHSLNKKEYNKKNFNEYIHLNLKKKFASYTANMYIVEYK